MEDKLRLRVTAPDSKTVAISFGGGTNYLSESVKATQTPGAIKANTDILEALEHMPKDKLGLMLLNMNNLTQVVNNAYLMLGVMPMPSITTKTPVTIGFGVTGNESEIVMYVPNSLMMEIIQIRMMILMSQSLQSSGPGGPGSAPSHSSGF